MPETPVQTDHIRPKSLPPVGILSRGGSECEHTGDITKMNLKSFGFSAPSEFQEAQSASSAL